EALSRHKIYAQPSPVSCVGLKISSWKLNQNGTIRHFPGGKPASRGLSQDAQWGVQVVLEQTEKGRVVRSEEQPQSVLRSGGCLGTDQAA
ncbi:Hypothetical predicted protein, partial [Marmota monax]